MSDLDAVEVLEPEAKSYDITIGDRTFTQKPLTFFRKIELFSVLADALDKALADGAIISEFLDDIPTGTGDLREADVFVKAIAKIVRYAPDILGDVFCISLDVKRNERDEVKELFDELSDEEAMQILNNFIDQNWDAMADFFTKQMAPLVGKVSEKVQSQSASSTPSKPSRTPAQKK
jgi:hypothetical protein